MCLEDESTGLRLAFKAYPKDPLFRVYTEPFTQQANNLLYFTNQQISRKKQGVFRLHKSEFVSPESLVNLGTEVLDAVLSKQDRYIPPALAVSIQAEGKNNPLFDSAGKPKAPTYLIKFASRRTYWRYYLVGSKMDDSVFIIDTDDGIGFESTELITLSDGRTAHSCRSIKSIPLQQSYPYKFQLKQRKNGGEKILFRQLPFPKVGQTGIEVVAKQAVVVSEIFVNY
jgi:hypothetical protein